MLILMFSLCLPLVSTHAVANSSEMIAAAQEGIGPSTLDPAWCYDTASGELVFNVYQTLIFFDREKTDQFVPMLAKSWTVSADGLTYSFQIRGIDGTEPPVKFHNGDNLTTEDVEYSFERLMVQDRSGGPAWMFYEPLLDRLSSRDDAGNILVTAEQIDNAITRNATTVTFHLAKPYPPFLQVLSIAWASILNKDWCVLLGDWPGTWENWQNYSNPLTLPIDAQDTQAPGPHVNAMCGTGPYYLEYLDDTLEEWSIRKFDDYWGGWPASGARGFVERAKVTWHYTWEERRDMFLAGQIDSLSVPRSNVAEVLGQPGVRCLYPLSNLDCNALLFNFNINETSPNMGVPGGLPRGTVNESGIPPDFFSDIDARKGFAYCINYTKLIDEFFFGEAYQPATPIIWGLQFYNAEQEKYSINLAKAEEHFRVAWGGQLWTKGFRMTFTHGNANLQLQRTYEMIKANVESLNSKFHIDIMSLSGTEYGVQRTQGQQSIMRYMWLADFCDPHDFALGFMYSPVWFAQWQHYANATIDALIEAGIRELDPNRRKQIYYDIQSLYHEDCPSVPLYQDRTRRFERDWVQGWYFNLMISAGSYQAPSTTNYFYALWKEESPPTEVNAGSNIVDKLDASGTIVLINTTATGNVSLSKHDINIEGTIPPDLVSMKCVLFDSTLDPGEIVFPIEIRIYFTEEEAESARVAQSTLCMYYWNGTGWGAENDTGVVIPSDVSGFVGYVWANVTHLSMFALIARSGADVALTDLGCSKTVVGQGYVLFIMVTVENQGDLTETFNVTVYFNETAIMIEEWPDGATSQIFWSMGDVNRDGYIDNWDVYETTQAFNTRPGNPRWNPDFDINGDGVVNMKDISTCIQNFGKDIWTFLALPKLIENQRAVTLLSGNSSIITFRWNTTGVVEGNYTIGAYAWPVPGETNTADNTFMDGMVRVGIPGDINADGVVDIYDAIILAGAYNSKLNDSIWNANADINSDANVDIYDAIILAGNFNKHYP
jgi:peptide/nickel transport system substrate-binding protein